jgi:hypothetical protein
VPRLTRWFLRTVAFETPVRTALYVWETFGSAEIVIVADA